MAAWKSGQEKRLNGFQIVHFRNLRWLVKTWRLMNHMAFGCFPLCAHMAHRNGVWDRGTWLHMIEVKQLIGSQPFLIWCPFPIVTCHKVIREYLQLHYQKKSSTYTICLTSSLFELGPATQSSHPPNLHYLLLFLSAWWLEISLWKHPWKLLCTCVCVQSDQKPVAVYTPARD